MPGSRYAMAEGLRSGMLFNRKAYKRINMLFLRPHYSI